MNKADKINKIAEWIRYESDSSIEEIESLLFAIYEPSKSGLTKNLNDDFGDVLEHLKPNKVILTGNMVEIDISEEV